MIDEVLYFFSVKLVNNNGKRLSWRTSLIIQKIQIATPKIYYPSKSIRDVVDDLRVHPVITKTYPIAINKNNCI